MRPIHLPRPRSLALSLSLALALSPSLAHAAPPAPPPSPSSPSPSSPSSAQDHYTAGRENYRLGLFGRALEEFERSLSLAPSPNTRLYLARTLRELGRWSEAAEHYAHTIREADQRGGKYVATRDAATVELADVKARLERATATPDKNDKSPAVDAVTDPTAAPSSPSSTARPASAISSSSPSPPSVAPAAEPRRAITTATWISGGVAVAGAASFAVLYALSSSRYGYLEDNCTVVRSSACDDARTTGKAEELGAYVSLGVAALAAAVTVYSLVTTPSAPSSAAATSKREPWRLAF